MNTLGICSRAYCIMLSVAVATASTVASGAPKVKFGSAMEVEVDGVVRSFAANDTFTPTAIPCVYRMRPANLSDGERTFAIKGSEELRGGDPCWRFPQYGDGNWVRVALDPYADAGTTVTLTGYKTSSFFYVDAERGSDGWDGTTDYEHRDTQNNHGPKKSLQAANDAATGNFPIIFAAPGVYNTGAATNHSSGTSNPCVRRLISTKNNIGFVATEGAEKTFIVGASDTTGTDGKYGSGSIAGVYMQPTASSAQFLQGFTITGCYSPAAQSGANQYGVGFCSGAHRSYCLDCVISNNYAISQGSASYYGVVERTRILENESNQFVTRNGVFISCVLARNRIIMSDSTASNRAQQQKAYSYFCTYDLRNSRQVSGRKRLEDDDSYVYAALVCGLTEKSTTTTNATRWLNGSRTVEDPRFVDAAARNYRLEIDSPAIDVLSYADDLGGMARMLLSSCDVYGSPRVLNGAIDIGAAEYDWRPTFAQVVGKRVTLANVSPSVTTNAAGGLLIPSGAVGGTVSECGKYVFAFELSGGSLEAFVGGESRGVRSAAGGHKIVLDMPDADTEFRFVFTPDAESPGHAVLKGVGPGGGFVVCIR